MAVPPGLRKTSPLAGAARVRPYLSRAPEGTRHAEQPARPPSALDIRLGRRALRVDVCASFLAAAVKAGVEKNEFAEVVVLGVLAQVHRNELAGYDHRGTYEWSSLAELVPKPRSEEPDDAVRNRLWNLFPGNIPPSQRPGPTDSITFPVPAAALPFCGPYVPTSAPLY